MKIQQYQFNYMKNSLRLTNTQWDDTKGKQPGLIEQNELTKGNKEISNADWQKIDDWQKYALDINAKQNYSPKLSVVLADPQITALLNAYNLPYFNIKEVTSWFEIWLCYSFGRRSGVWEELGLIGLHDTLKMAEMKKAIIANLPEAAKANQREEIEFNENVELGKRKLKLLLKDPEVQELLKKYQLPDYCIQIDPYILRGPRGEHKQIISHVYGTDADGKVTSDTRSVEDYYLITLPADYSLKKMKAKLEGLIEEALNE